jgi:hypothetical protein
MPGKTIPEIGEEEQDVPTSKTFTKARIEKIRLEREEDRKDADSAHARIRDTWVTVAGMVLILLLIVMHYLLAWFPPSNKEYGLPFMKLVESVIMLIIGYIFGTKITRS